MLIASRHILSPQHEEAFAGYPVTWQSTHEDH